MAYYGCSRGCGPLAEIRNLRDKHQRTQTSMAIVRQLRPKLQAVVAPFAGATIQF